MHNAARIEDRRDRPRFNIKAPLTVIAGEHEITAYTHDLSNRGVYFYLSGADSVLVEREFNFVIELPAEYTLSTCCLIRCRGRVLRKESDPKHMTGIAAEILQYAILRDGGASA
jgi:hypothetical protein